MPVLLSCWNPISDKVTMIATEWPTPTFGETRSPRFWWNHSPPLTAFLCQRHLSFWVPYSSSGQFWSLSRSEGNWWAGGRRHTLRFLRVIIPLQWRKVIITICVGLKLLFIFFAIRWYYLLFLTVIIKYSMWGYCWTWWVHEPLQIPLELHPCTI